MISEILMSFLFCLIIFASSGKTFGIRKAYVQLLVRLFEYGRVNIESAVINRKNSTSVEECVDKSKRTACLSKDISENSKSSLEESDCKSNGVASVISKESLILTPEGETAIQSNVVTSSSSTIEQRAIDFDSRSNNTESNDGNNCDSDEKEEKQMDFKIEDCLEYLKSGMEAIIEDSVTSRFEAEELKNWNLLTRTNRRYEFISWKLTVIWVVGFLLRYIVLMPLRVVICFIGVCWFVVAFTLVGLVPNEKLRRRLNETVSMIGFRIITRSLSAVITIHNNRYKPKNCGFCVANHTSPIDVTILSTNCTFSLVRIRAAKAAFKI